MRRARGMRISAQAHEHAVRDAVRAVQVILGASPHHDQAERMHGVRDAVRAVQVMLGASPHHDQAEQMHNVRDALRAVQVMLGASSIPCLAHPREHAVRMLAAIARHAVHETLGATRPCAERIQGARRSFPPPSNPSPCHRLSVPSFHSLCPPFPHLAIPSLCLLFLRSALPFSLSAIPSMCPPFLPFALHSLTPPSPLSALHAFSLPCHSPSLPSPLCALLSFPLPAIPSPHHLLSVPSVSSCWPPFPNSIRPTQGNSLLLVMYSLPTLSPPAPQY
ncbi:unnamed protein product [Closterium sp. NIES-53]